MSPVQNASCASASVSRTRSEASPSGVGGGEQQTGAGAGTRRESASRSQCQCDCQCECESGARDDLPPRDRAGIWSTAAAPLGVTETAPLTPIALRRVLYSMLYRRVLADLGLSLLSNASDYKCSSDCALELELECGGGGGAIANSDSASSSGAQQKRTCRLLLLEVHILYSVLHYECSCCVAPARRGARVAHEFESWQ